MRAKTSALMDWVGRESKAVDDRKDQFLLYIHVTTFKLIHPC